ncbi:MAG: helix-turn-helix domain-containing protein [Clostridia bacterium]|nr:helix-turn-helix domain-containing protein [Clostridia bacterium]
MKILNFGSCNIDYVYSMDHIVRVGETLSTYKLETFEGGKGLNQSIAIARAGAKVYHAGCVGEDGKMLTDLLSKSGVDLTYLKTVEGKNGHAIIQVSSKGENSIFLYGGSNEMVTEDFVDSVLENFSEGDIILLQNEISSVPYIIDRAYEKKMCIVFNPSPFTDEIKKLDLNKLSYVLLNEVEASEFSGYDDPEASLSYFEENYPSLKVILTLGSKGCIYLDNGTRYRQYAFKTNAVDTTAAGDTFTGYFVAGVCGGIDTARNLKLASAAAAITVSRMGAAPSIPLMDEVLFTLGTLKSGESDAKSEMLKKQIVDYVEGNVKDASLSELASLLNYSVIYSGHLVKKLTGKPFSKLLQDARCDKASEYLIRSDMSVREIISAVGYENGSFFRAIFKERFGDTPLQYRQKKGKFI